MLIKSRALAAFIEMESGVFCAPRVDGFEFIAEPGVTGVCGKNQWEWGRAFQSTRFSEFNQRLRMLGDEQRELTNTQGIQ